MSSKKMSMRLGTEYKRKPGNYTRATSYGAAKYVKKIDYDKETGGNPHFLLHSEP